MTPAGGAPVKLGVIGGSGVYQMEGAEIVGEHEIETPFGPPSDLLVETVIDGRTVFFLPRHGRGHRLLPSEVPYRANVHAMKSAGVTHLLAVSAVGIMKEHIRPPATWSSPTRSSTAPAACGRRPSSVTASPATCRWPTPSAAAG